MDEQGCKINLYRPGKTAFGLDDLALVERYWLHLVKMACQFKIKKKITAIKT